jgi:hypothetical protein
LEAITMYCFNINVDESDLYTVIKFIPSCLYFTWVSYSMIKRLFQYYIWWLELRCITPLISVIAWRAVLLVEETGVPVEYHRSAARHWQTLWHNVVSSTPLLSGIQTHNFSGDRHWLHM